MAGKREEKSMFGRIVSTLTRGSRLPTPHYEQRPAAEDLGLKTLRQVYSHYTHIDNPASKERQLYKLLPLFCKNCSNLTGQELVTKFPEAFDFAENVAFLFVRHVTQLAQSTNARAGATLLQYFQAGSGDDAEEPSDTGLIVLRAIQILANGTEPLITVMMSSNLASILVRCIHLFLDLPPPAVPVPERGQGEALLSPMEDEEVGEEEEDGHGSEMSRRIALQKLMSLVLNRLLRNASAVDNLLRFGSGDLSLLFGAISSPCPQYNKIWRKTAGDCLVTICRRSLSGDVINFIHSKGCIKFCIHNITVAWDQPPLELVEILATIFCCLKDSSDFSQVLLDDFSTCGGYKFLFQYLLHLERMGTDDARDAERNVVLLTSTLVLSGFLSLEPTLNDGGPFQDSGFSIPVPIGDGSSVKNVDAFRVLQDAFLSSNSSHLGKTIIDSILNVFRSDPANYFILEPQHTLPNFLEVLLTKNDDVQAHVFLLLEFVMVELNYVPTAELTSLGLLLQEKQHPKTVSLVLNFLLRLISHTAEYKKIFREVGIFTMLINFLKSYAEDIGEVKRDLKEKLTIPANARPSSGMSSPSLPLEDLHGAEEECIFLLMECLRATIEGKRENGQMFRELGGTKCTLALVNYKKPRRMALRLLTQLILLPDGSVDFNALLDQLNTSAQTAVVVKIEILQTVLGVFQLDSGKKAVFREVCGFHYLISVLASLIGSLAPRRSTPWIGVPRTDILHLVQLVFTIMTTAMQDDPANRMFFETNIRFDSFTAPLQLLGCFVKELDSFNSSTDLNLNTSGSYTSFNAEFKTWQPPSDQIDDKFFVHSAAEIFRYLRDMALNVPHVQSKSLLQIEPKEKIMTISAMMSASRYQPVAHLVHPGAVLCMVDLLPGVNLEPSYLSLLQGDDGGPLSEQGAKNESQESLDQELMKRTLEEEEVLPEKAVVEEKGDSNKNASSEGLLSEPKADALNASLLEDFPSEDVDVPIPCDFDGNEIEDFELGERENGDSESDCTPSRKKIEWEDDYVRMPASDAKKWCMFLQERVVAEIYTLAMTERNQQALCQVGLPQRMLQCCSAVLADDAHPLHQALERTFERLSYQALTPSDFRNFLRLGNPLSCLLNNITLEELTEEGERKAADGGDLEAKEGEAVQETSHMTTDDQSQSKNEPTNHPEPYGSPLSLARIQSLVSMTTPRDGYQIGNIGNPAFVEFDLSIDGFASLFIPSVFPQSFPQPSHDQGTVASITTGIGGGGERAFPPANGLTFSTWIFISKYNAGDAHPLGLLTLSQSFLTSEKKPYAHPCLRIFILPSEQTLVVTTQLPRDRRDTIIEDIALKTEKERGEEARFSCPQFFQLQTWHHVAVVINKTLRGKAKVTVFIDSQVLGTQKMSYIHLVHLLADNSSFLPYPSETMPFLINAHIGTHVTQRHVSQLTYRLGPTFLFEDPLASQTIHYVFKLGPSYLGSFQAPILEDAMSTSLAPGVRGEPLNALMAEEKVVFGIIAYHPLTKTVAELGKTYSTVDVATIARELSLREDDDVTPVTLLLNSTYHLFGPSRGLGAIICGYSGIRTFEPQPLRSLLSSVGGTSVVLGLVAMATTVDSLYASMKALVCIVGNNPFALKEMERTGGFQVLGMLLYSKSHLINGNILHLTYTLVGTVNSEHESACIPNPIAFRDLLADLTIWSGTSQDIQRSLYNHFYELLTHTTDRQRNAEHMLGMKLVSTLLYRLHDSHLLRVTIKAICNVLSALLGSKPGQDDIRRVGQLLATTLPAGRQTNENSISLYDRRSDSAEEEPTEHAQSEDHHDGQEAELTEDSAPLEHHDDHWGKQRRAIILRNMLLDVFESLLNDQLELNTHFAHQLYRSLGLDWILLFLQPEIHMETVTRAVRILLNLLCDPSLRLKFHEGEIFGGWVHGFDSISMEMTQMLEHSTSFSPLKASLQSPLPGAMILSQLLPYHLNTSQSSQIFLLMIALLLGAPASEIPFSAKFDPETLDSMFPISSFQVESNIKLCADAAHVLLAMARVLLHKEHPNHSSQSPTVVLIKFFERLYSMLPQFVALATTQEFIEALAATLFPPPAPVVSRGVWDGDGEVWRREDVIDHEFVVLSSDSASIGSQQEQQPQHSEIKPALFRQDSLAVCSILKLIRKIAVDGFSSTQMSPKDIAVCPVLETVFAASPASISQELQREYQSATLHSIMEYLQSGNEDILVLFKATDASAFPRAISGLSVFCARLVDKLWQGVYLKPGAKVYSFLLLLVEQARKLPTQLPLGDFQRSLNRLILYQLSSIPSTEAEQKALMDTLCLFSSQASIIFGDTNFDSEFLECLCYRLIQIVGSDTKQASYNTPGYVPLVSHSMMKSGANRLWSKMLEYKREQLEQILSTEFPPPLSTASVVRDTNKDNMGLGVSLSNPSYMKLQNCEDLNTDQLRKAWDVYLSGEKVVSTPDLSQRSSAGRSKSIFRKAAAGVLRRDRDRGRSVNIENLVQEYVDIVCPLLVLASQKYEEILLKKHQRNMDYRLRFTASEWKRIECELTRERGLWGPEKSSKLDKWMLDSVEGPFRMRKRLCRNSLFYQHYPYTPNEAAEVKASKYHHPVSLDSKLFYRRANLFQRSSLLSSPTPLPRSSHGNLPHIYGHDVLMNVSIDYSHGGAPNTDVASPSHLVTRVTPLNQPDTDDPVAQALYKMIEPDDKITAQFQCARLTGLDSRDGILLLGTTHFYVVEGVTIMNNQEIIDIESAPEDSYDPVVPSYLHYSTIRKGGMPVPIGCVKWPYDTIREIHKRRYLLRHCGLEVFSSDGRNQFLIFHMNEREKISQKLHSLAKSSLTESSSQFVAGTHPETDPEQAPGIISALLTGEKSLPERWANGEISNFQYLMQLNTLAGRTYTDLMQYPVFPWVLADYTSETLDLTNPATFRDFSKPMGAQTPARLERFVERHKYFEDPTGEETPAYYYGTHYSSAMIVASYLIRMEPFTQHFLKLQGGHFDLPDRLFHSIPDAWRSTSETNMADIRELIPEFFYLPDFLVNHNNFDLGAKQSGERLSDIILPPWAKGDPHEFIRLHREALECDYVSAHLHEWIDLIFGYQQKGEEALKAHNVFHHLFYEGSVDIDKIEEPVKRNAAISFIHNFGQMPKQIFRRPHRQRKVFTSLGTPGIDSTLAPPTNLPDLRRIFYKNMVHLLPSKEPVKEIRGEVSQMVYMSERHLVAVERNKVLLTPGYSRYFMWGFPDRSARIALVEGDKVVSVFEGLHPGRILCATVRGEDMLLTAGDSTVVYVWEMKNVSSIKERSRTQLHLKHTLHGHTAPVTCLATSCGYNLIISGSKDKTCILWDINKFICIRQLCGHNGPVTMVTINQLNGDIVSCTKNHICLWTVNGTLLGEANLMLTGNFRILCCAMSELFEWDKDNVIITGSTDGIVRMWALEYVPEAEQPQKLLKPRIYKEESSLDHPNRARAATLVRKLRHTLKKGSPRKVQQGEDGDGAADNEGNSEEEYFDTSDQMKLVQPGQESDGGDTESNTGIGTEREAATIAADPVGGATTEDTAEQSGQNESDGVALDTAETLEATVLEPRYNQSDMQRTMESGAHVPEPDTGSASEVNDATLLDSVIDDSRTPFSDSKSEDQSIDPERQATSETTSESGNGENMASGPEQSGSSPEAAITGGDKDKAAGINSYVQFLAEAKRKAEELKEKAGRWKRQLTLVHTLTMHTSYHRKDNDTPAAVTSICISKDHRRLFIGDSRGRVFSWVVAENLGGIMEHWLKDEAVEKCMRCTSEFTFTERKHHCRDCGGIFCAKCSAYECEVERLKITKKVRVCVDCFDKLTGTRKQLQQNAIGT